MTDQPTYTINPTRLNWADLALTVTTFAKGVSEAAHDAWSYLDLALAAHSAHLAEKQDFAKDAGRDIESLTHNPPPTQPPPT